MEEFTIQLNDIAVRTISKTDPQMKKLIQHIGPLTIHLRTNYFDSLVRSIIGQLISTHAAEAIYQRMLQLLNGEISVQGILQTDMETLYGTGLTRQKTAYIKGLANMVESDALNLTTLPMKTDAKVIKELTKIKGIGKWTAEVFLLLALGRKDVLADGDVALQRAASWLYQVDKSQRQAILLEKSNLWQPYRSIGCFYLWEAIHLDLVGKYENVDDMKYQA